MKMSGNTILITGGGSGIGRALAEAFHKLGNQVIIAGRRPQVLDEVTRANSGMKSLTLDIEDAAAIRAFAAKVTAENPKLNVLLNNAGIMRPENRLAKPTDVADAEATIATNLLGPIRLTAALVPHFLKQSAATIINLSSGLAFVPMSATPTYCATKAAIHSYTQSLREQLKRTSIEVLELIPPYVATELMGAQQAADPHAMALDQFISEAMALFKAQPVGGEIVVERCKPLRFAAENGKFAEMFRVMNPVQNA